MDAKALAEKIYKMTAEDREQRGHVIVNFDKFSHQLGEVGGTVLKVSDALLVLEAEGKAYRELEVCCSNCERSVYVAKASEFNPPYACHLCGYSLKGDEEDEYDLRTKWCWSEAVMKEAKSKSSSCMHFQIGEEEHKAFKKWVDEHDKSCKYADRLAQGAIGGRFTFQFTPTGLGEVIKVSCACGKTVDLTDYSCW